MTWTAAAEQSVLIAMVAFCRVGACLMVMPGFSSSRVPMQARLFIALLITLALAPLVQTSLAAAIQNRSWAALTPLILAELSVGLTIGLMGRLFVLALQFLASAAAMAIGYTSISDGVEDGEAEPELASLIMITAGVLFFALGQHMEVLRALLSSYAVIKVGEPVTFDMQLAQLTDVLAGATLLALQVVSPFIIFSVMVNFLFGVVNKLVPQAPVAFISAPFVIAGSLFLLVDVIRESLTVFMAGFSQWLRG